MHFFKQNLRLHSKDRPKSKVRASQKAPTVDQFILWLRPRTEPMSFPREPWPPLFANHKFIAHQLYGAGVADMVGYWAEDSTLGSAVLHDRRDLI